MKVFPKNLTLKVIFGSLIACLNASANPADAKAKELVEIKAELSKPWTPPAVEKSAVASVRKRRAQTAPIQYGAASTALNKAPENAAFCAIDYLPEPLAPTTEATNRQERTALAASLQAYLDSGDAEAVEPLESFARQYPDSPWTPGLLLNLGIIAYDTGYFIKALECWKLSWDGAKDNTNAHATAIANRAVAEYAKMCARVGRKDDLEAVFAETKDRTFQGTAKVLMDSARAGYWAMLNKGGITYRCGPYALTNLASELIPSNEAICAKFLEDIHSPDTGFSLEQVQAMSKALNLNLQMVKRSVGAKVLVPAVVHWKVGHYGALVREMNGKYLLKDPTFGNETWMSAQAIDQEASGFFLIPSGDLPPGWSAATESEALTIFGKGQPGSGGEEETSQDDQKNGGDCDGQLAMATYSFHTLLASLSVSDTPVGYSPAYGPNVSVKVTYNQREFGQPTTINYTNFSPQWVNTWVSYLEDNPSSPGANITLYLRGGGSETHTGFDTSTQSYEHDVQSSAILVKLTADTYKKVYPDGSQEYYEQFIGTTGIKRKIFLSRVVDPQGNAVTLQYHASYPSRLQYIHDAAGLSTEFFYTYPEEPYLVTRVEDPYGRAATFSYYKVGNVVRLTDIEDVYGIISSFDYNSEGGITALMTPYGTTAFKLSDFQIDASYSLIRYIEATDPYGDKERIEYNASSSQTGMPGNINEPLPDSSKVAYTTGNNSDRNSFYWDKQQMRYGAGNYAKAHLYHWIQPTRAYLTTSILESEKPPLEGRIWYNYPGQSVPYIQGDLASPSVIGRVVEDETGALVTQASRFEYNTLGNLTGSIDPLNRKTLIEYAANNIDVLFIKQRTGGTDAAPVYSTLASYTYDPADPPHLPRTFTDSAGSTTTFSYNVNGQILTVANELDEVITFTYETHLNNNGYGRVLTITGNVPGGDVTYTYDDFDRVRTVTDSEGYTLTYDYDALDRVTLITYPDNSYEQFDYKNHSMVASRDREGRWTRYFYDALRRPILELDPLGQFTQYEWCRCGDIRKPIDGEGNTTHWVRDVQGRVTEKRFADGTSQHFTYQPQSGQLQTVADALDQVANYSYFVDGNLALIDYSETGTPDESFTYETYYDRIDSMTDGIGTTGFTYYPDNGSTDGAGSLARIDGPFADDTLKYTYDVLGRLKKREIVDDATYTTANYSEEYTFDNRSRVKEVINNLGAFEYTYIGQSGRVDYVDYPNGMKTDYTYTDATGDHRIRQIKHLNGATSPRLISRFDYTYHPDRNIKTWKTRQNGAAAEQWIFDYDAALRLSAAVRKNANTQTVLEQFNYGYDKSGNRTSITTSSTHTNYPANNLNQTIAEQGFGKTKFSGTLDEPAIVMVNDESAKVTSDGGSAPYTFEAMVDLKKGDNSVTINATDGNENTVTQTYSINTRGIQKRLEYDSGGNLRYERRANRAVVLREYEWDAKNRLRAIQNGAVGSEIDGTKRSEFEYDGSDRRVRIIEKTYDGTAWTIDSENIFIWNGSQILQKRDGTGTTVMRSYFGNGFEEDDVDYYYTRDHLGSIREVVAADGTTIKAMYDYSPWGEVTKIGGSGAESDFLYTGHYFHTPSDLFLTHYRAYNPELGQWLSRDPIAENGGINLYAYVLNDPVNYVDPDGRIPVPVVIGLGALATYGIYKGVTGLYNLVNGFIEGGNAMQRSIDDAANANTIEGAIAACQRRTTNFNQAVNNSVIPIVSNAPGTTITGPASLSVTDTIRKSTSDLLKLKRAGDIEGIAQSFKSLKNIMEKTGYKWIESPSSNFGGYFRKPKNSSLPSAKEVNDLLKDL